VGGGETGVSLGLLLSADYRWSASERAGRYLKESSPEDLEGHGEGEGGALPTLAQVVEGRLAHHRRGGAVIISSVS